MRGCPAGQDRPGRRAGPGPRPPVGLIPECRGRRIAGPVPIPTAPVAAHPAREEAVRPPLRPPISPPSAVSQASRRTEETLGVVLFERVGQGIAPTPAG
ncbi:helix-turn-helix domain-containing protein [Methylobacterium sp. A52T]